MLKFFLISLFSLILYSKESHYLKEWEVIKVKESKNYYGEIRYPKEFEIYIDKNVLKGKYIDQDGYKGKFNLITFINNKRELLFTLNGVTKYKTSYMPIFKVKFKNGKLRILAITDRVEFELIAKEKKFKKEK